ncbi:MAG TPA: hypothetical protein VHZ03_15615 [Trebonia sp.]|nr:hypothetical protein [Trebonia sp.]
MPGLADVRRLPLATELGAEPGMFPGGHMGYIGDLAAFAARLGVVLGQR